MTLRRSQSARRHETRSGRAGRHTLAWGLVSRREVWQRFGQEPDEADCAGTPQSLALPVVERGLSDRGTARNGIFGNSNLPTWPRPLRSRSPAGARPSWSSTRPRLRTAWAFLPVRAIPSSLAGSRGSAGRSRGASSLWRRNRDVRRVRSLPLTVSILLTNKPDACHFELALINT